MADRAEFERTIMPHLDAAHNLARWLIRDAALAEDVVQDAMVRALGYFGSFRGDNPRAWLLRILRNAAYDAIAARGQERTVSLDGEGEDEPAALQVPDLAPDPEAAMVRTEGRQRLDLALAALPAELRECLVLRELEELSYKEISRITNAPIGTVMSRLWRARRLLLGGGAEGATS